MGPREFTGDRFPCCCGAWFRVYATGPFAGKIPDHTDDEAARPTRCVGSYGCPNRHRCNHQVCLEMCRQDGCADTDVRDLAWPVPGAVREVPA